MQIKKLVLVSFLLVMTLVFYGCNLKGKANSTSADFFKDLNQYEANVTVTFLKDKQPNTIKMKQIAKTDGTYEMTVLGPEHLKDVKMTCDGQRVLEYYPSINRTVEQQMSKAQNEILLTSFAKRYMTNENIKKQETQLDGKKMITYEMSIEGDFKYLSKEKIWLEEKNLTPVQMVLYDDEGNITIEVIYNDFKYNF
ncbi:MAG: hypothetical protein E7231_10320 [Cellulosilyticum sp.]|nr:hypothetical protein [Cellulosilyticum sp.]